MIHVLIGTKAQFIKMAAVMQGLAIRKVPFNVIPLGQHAETVARLARQFDMQDALPPLRGRGAKDVASIPGAAGWLAVRLLTILFRPGYLRDTLFQGRGGIALIHGDTLSTLVGLLMAKRAGLRVAHVESGLRSWSFLHPFPEEGIRVICMRYADYLFAPSDEAAANCAKMEVPGRVYRTPGNTGMDAVRAVASGHVPAAVKPEGRYVLVSIHRFENLYSRGRMKCILDAVEEVARRYPVRFILHKPLERRLRTSGSRDWLPGRSGDAGRPSRSGSAITCLPLQEYPQFLEYIKHAEFVITDGGSVQEECYYFGVPCLIMRKGTERSEGIGENAVLSKFDKDIMDVFFRSYQEYRRQPMLATKSPANSLVETVLQLSG